VRVLMISQDFPPRTGGIETYACELAAQLVPHCESLEMVCPEAPGSRAIDARLPFAVKRIRASTDTLPVAAAPYLTRRVEQDAIDVLFHVQWQTAPIGALLRKTGRLPTLAIAVHGKELLLRPLAALPALQNGYDRLRKSVLESADVVLPVSEFSAELLRQNVTREARISVVPNGVDASRLAGGDGAAFRSRHGLSGSVLMTVARLVPRKGVDSVIACLPALCAQVPEITYAVVGQGPDEPRLRALASELGVAERVRFLGRIADHELAAAYASCDAFVLAARDEPDSVEGFGLVLLEAGACARPCVATRAGGMAEAVRDGETGLIVPANDAQALTAAITRLLTDPALARRLGEAGRRHASAEGSWARTAERVLAALSRARTEP
jgi:phosphatidylinositol alpha-1,6-mannosyltransferase